MEDGTGFDPAAQGWKALPGDDFPTLIGPFWGRRREDGRWSYAFLADQRHRNGHGIVHGGMIMSFADQAFGAAVWEAIGRRPCVTVQLNVQFIGPARPGDFVEARAEVLRTTRSVVFVRGVLEADGRMIAAADGVWKILGAA
jgi:uncharacterized protein (TIGR00369 family)